MKIYANKLCIKHKHNLERLATRHFVSFIHKFNGKVENNLIFVNYFYLLQYDNEYGRYDDEMHTGDPNLDLEYERNMNMPKVPDVVKNFIDYFRNVINEGVVYEIQNLYENTFPKLSEQYYDKRAWPSESQIADLIGDDEVFLTLYKELYYRHIYARIPKGPTIQERADSFFNYCSFFNLILSAPKPVQLELPDIWLWELLDEFVYQFQNYAQYRARLNDKSEEEMNILKHTNHWTILCILNVLHSLVEKSNIKLQLEVSASGGDPESVAGEFGRHSLYKMLGYFSLVEMLRLHSLLGDYYQAIKVLEPIEIHKKNQYTHIPACQISTSYYVGFAYMMMRRYTDAIRTFSSILLYIQRTKQLYSTRSYQNDQINKQTEQMYQLLSICLVLHPQPIDESIQQALRFVFFVCFPIFKLPETNLYLSLSCIGKKITMKTCIKCNVVIWTCFVSFSNSVAQNSFHHVHHLAT